MSQATQPTGGQAGCDLVANNSGPTGAGEGLEKETSSRGSAPASVHSLALLFFFLTPLKNFLAYLLLSSEKLLSVL